ncbi:MAG: UxaA family hydrolase [Leadbetterella sp.]
MNSKIFRIHHHDNLIIALTEISKGEILEIDNTTISIQENIKVKHKFALVDLAENDDIKMYGIVVGKASSPIPAGAAITTKNTYHQTEPIGIREPNHDWIKPNIDMFKDRTFAGYERKDKQVGTQNNWIVFPLVFCENANIEKMKDAFLETLGFIQPNPYKSYVNSLIRDFNHNSRIDTSEKMENTKVFENVDNLVFLTHQGGCGGTREDALMLCKLLAGYIKNPNVAGATILSLGCQNAQIEMFQTALKDVGFQNDKPLYFIEHQKEGTEKDMLKIAIEKTFEGLKEANKLHRSPQSISKLVIGLECGGSDGFSGITANPLLGEISDRMALLNGTTILSEFPELCGVEQEIINRCTNDGIASKFLTLMKNYEQSAIAVGSGFDMNPSPGNIKDGLITDAMKSAGAAKKGGSSEITDVLDYTEYIKYKGLNLLCTPGNDVESTTALAGSGANVILFTTGLGTPTGNPICPVIKVSSNSNLAEKMHDIIDYDSGKLLSGNVDMATMADDFLDYIIKIASGEIATKAQKNNQMDFIPWKRGVSL